MQKLNKTQYYIKTYIEFLPPTEFYTSVSILLWPTFLHQYRAASQTLLLLFKFAKWNIPNFTLYGDDIFDLSDQFILKVQKKRQPQDQKPRYIIAADFIFPPQRFLRLLQYYNHVVRYLQLTYNRGLFFHILKITCFGQYFTTYLQTHFQHQTIKNV